MIKHSKNASVIKRYAIIFLGVILTALGISIFYTPNKIVSGGVSGLSTILYHALGIQPGFSFAVINIVLNLLWIPKYGVNGAAAATLACYAIVFIVRALDTRRYVRINWQYVRLLMCTGIVLIQTVIMLKETPLWIVSELLLFVAMLLLCAKDLLAGVRHMLKR